LVRRLAQATGTTQTAAVDDAVRRRLVEVDSASVEAGRDAAWREFSRLIDEFRTTLADSERQAMDQRQRDLYNDAGLPQ
jgi:antitoxin VapB